MCVWVGGAESPEVSTLLELRHLRRGSTVTKPKQTKLMSKEDFTEKIVIKSKLSLSKPENPCVAKK